MSTETDEARTAQEEDAVSGPEQDAQEQDAHERDVMTREDWASDEAAAEQEQLIADQRHYGGNGTAPEPDEADEADMADEQEPAPLDPPQPNSNPYFPDSVELPSPAVPAETTTSAAPEQAETAAAPHSGGEPLIADEARDAFLSRWNEIQVSFVEDPGASVENAVTLSQEVGAALLASFEDRTTELATAWHDASDTEQLRLVLKQYRAFIGVLLPR